MLVIAITNTIFEPDFSELDQVTAGLPENVWRRPLSEDLQLIPLEKLFLHPWGAHRIQVDHVQSGPQLWKQLLRPVAGRSSVPVGAAIENRLVDTRGEGIRQAKRRRPFRFGPGVS